MNPKKKRKKCIIIIIKKKNIDNLHFIPNNILTNFFKELTKYKNDYQQYLNYIYIYELYYASYGISLNVFMHTHGVTSQYIIIGKIEKNSN